MARRNINNLRYVDDTTFMARRTREPLDEGERRVKRLAKTQLSKIEDHGNQSHYFMAIRWGNNGNSDRLLFSWAP